MNTNQGNLMLSPIRYITVNPDTLGGLFDYPVDNFHISWDKSLVEWYTTIGYKGVIISCDVPNIPAIHLENIESVKTALHNGPIDVFEIRSKYQYGLFVIVCSIMYDNDNSLIADELRKL